MRLIKEGKRRDKIQCVCNFTIFTVFCTRDKKKKKLLSDPKLLTCIESKFCDIILVADYSIYYCGQLLLNQTILVEKVYKTSRDSRESARQYSSTILLTVTQTPVAVVDMTLS